MKIVCISDTHCALRKIKIPEGDILIHAGDFTYKGSIEEIESELDALAEIRVNFKEAIIIFGNHDRLGEQNPFVVQKLCEDRDILYLNDNEVFVEGLRIYGSPYSPTFPRKGIWAFNADRGNEIKAHWDLIPEGLDVLITHGPPYGIRDDVPDMFKGKIVSVGCSDLLRRVKEVKPKIHIFGHIHEGHGVTVTKDTTYVNASQLNDRYNVTYQPIIIELEDKKDE